MTHKFDCIRILYLTLTQYPCDPGTLPSSANQCILGNVYLRSNLSRTHKFVVTNNCYGVMLALHRPHLRADHHAGSSCATCTFVRPAGSMLSLVSELSTCSCSKYPDPSFALLNQQSASGLACLHRQPLNRPVIQRCIAPLASTTMAETVSISKHMQTLKEQKKYACLLLCV